LRSLLLQAAGALVLAGTTLASLPSPAAAANVDTPLRVYFTKLQCIDESDDWGNSDEPYVVLFAADMRGATPRAIVRRSAIFGDVDTGETRESSLQFWALDGSGDPIAGAEDFIFLVALLESDSSGNASNVQRRMESTLIPKLQSYKAAGLSRTAIANNLRADMDLVIQATKGSDEQYGDVRELYYYGSDLRRAQDGNAVDKTYIFQGGDYKYYLTFRLQ
jgi:hypothetical protein